MEEEKILEGLKYEKVVLDHNAHKLVGKVTKHQDGKTADVEIADGATWLVTGLGHLRVDTPEELIAASLDDIVIVSKDELINFIKSKNE